MSAPLSDDERLETSPVVANCRMNRERDLAGRNGYDRELRVSPLSLLPLGGRWLDLCCGTARALGQARRERPDIEMTGVDLVDHFAAVPEPRLRLVVSPLRAFEPEGQFDLIILGAATHGTLPLPVARRRTG